MFFKKYYTDSFGLVIRNLANSFFYFGNTIIALGLSLLTFPIYADNLLASDFGIIGFYGSIQSFFLPIFILSLPNYYLMYYYKVSEEENNLILFNLLFYLSLTNLGIIAIAHVIIFMYFKMANVSISFYPYATIVLFINFFSVFTTFALVHLRIRKQAVKFFIISTSISILNAFWGVLFVKYYHFGVTGRLSAILLSYFFSAIFSLVMIRKELEIKCNLKIFKTAIKRVYPLIASSYANIPIYSLDNIFLERLNNISELGHYNIGKQIAGFFKAAGTGLFQAFEPDFYQSLNQNNFKKYLKFVSIFVAIFFVGFLLFFKLTTPLMSYLTSDKFLEATKYTKIIVFGSMIFPLIQVFGVVLLSKEKVKQTASIDFIGAIGSLLLYYPLTKLFGFTGACLGQIFIPMSMLIAALFFILKGKLWKISR